MSYQPSSGSALVMRRGPQPDSTFLMNKDVITIGRAQGNDLVVDDGEMSRNHARLVQTGEDWILEDLGSVNGTFVNGQRITSPVPLTPGAEVAFGGNVLFSLQVTPISPAHPPGPDDTLAIDRGGFPWLWAIIGAGIVVLLLVVAGLAAYLLLSRRQAGGPSLAALAAMAQGPDVALQEPANNTQVKLGEEVLVFALARQEKGVTRMELWIDGEVAAQQDSPTPAGITPMSLVHTWASTTPGTKTLLVRAYDSQGAMGMSPLVYVTVLNQPADPLLGEYVVQLGDTLLGVAEEMSTTLQALQEANPVVGETITQGETIVVPIPTVIIATPTTQPPPPQPPPPPPPPQPPPNLPLNAPSLISATPQDCEVTLDWQDNSDNELGFLVYRAVSGVPGFSVLPTTAGAAPGTGSQVQYADQVPGPDDYIYYVAAANSGGQAASNLAAVNVPPSGGCVQPPGYKQVMYQPFTVQPTDPTHVSASLYYGLWESASRRIPPGSGDSIVVPDWSGIQAAAPVPLSVYLDTADPVLMWMVGEGWPGPDSLGFFLKAHPQEEMVPAAAWHGHGEDPVTLKGFDTDYNLWLENVTWGQGSSALIPPPTDLRLATTMAELDKMWYCTAYPCDPVSTRALVWDWTGYPTTIDGYMLYRFYSCPGQDTPIPAPDMVRDHTEQGEIVPAWTVPSACAARYQVSAFGPSGESAPSSPLDLPAAAPLVRLPVTFKTLTLSGLPPAGAWRKVTLTANQYVLRSGSQKFFHNVPKNLAALFLSGKMPNNELMVGLGAGDALQLGLKIADPNTNATICSDLVTFPPPAGNNWGIHAGPVDLNLDPACVLTVELGQPQTLAAGQATRPQGNLIYAGVPLGVIGTDVYVRLYNEGPDKLVGNTAQVTTYWIDPITNQPVNTQTAPRSITAGAKWGWMFRADTIPPDYVNMQPLPLFHVEWSPVDFDNIGIASKIHEGIPVSP